MMAENMFKTFLRSVQPCVCYFNGLDYLLLILDFCSLNQHHKNYDYNATRCSKVMELLKNLSVMFSSTLYLLMRQYASSRVRDSEDTKRGYLKIVEMTYVIIAVSHCRGEPRSAKRVGPGNDLYLALEIKKFYGSQKMEEQLEVVHVLQVIEKRIPRSRILYTRSGLLTVQRTTAHEESVLTFVCFYNFTMDFPKLKFIIIIYSYRQIENSLLYSYVGEQA